MTINESNKRSIWILTFKAIRKIFSFYASGRVSSLLLPTYLVESIKFHPCWRNSSYFKSVILIRVKGLTSIDDEPIKKMLFIWFNARHWIIMYIHQILSWSWLYLKNDNAYWWKNIFNGIHTEQFYLTIKILLKNIFYNFLLIFLD